LLHRRFWEKPHESLKNTTNTKNGTKKFWKYSEKQKKKTRKKKFSLNLKKCNGNR
jgi:hypothetical protein